MAINVTGKWDYAHGAHRHFTDSGKSHREIARESDSQTVANRKQQLPPKIFGIKCHWVSSGGRQSELCCGWHFAQAHKNVWTTREIGSEQATERTRVKERWSRRTTNYKSCKQNSVQSALAKLFEHCYLWTRVVYVINCCSWSIGTLDPRFTQFNEVATQQQSNEPQMLHSHCLSRPLKFRSILLEFPAPTLAYYFLLLLWPRFICFCFYMNISLYYIYYILFF